MPIQSDAESNFVKIGSIVGNASRNGNRPSNSFIYFLPAVFLVYTLLSAYQIDFRAFYVAARSVLLNLDPYLNPVTQFPELYAAINAEDAIASGFIYPPLAALLFLPLGFFPYATAKIVFSALILASLVALCLLFAKQRDDRRLTPGEAFLFVTCSFPLLATFERGQIDLVIVLLTWLSFQLYRSQKLFQSSLLLGLAICIKIFPAIVIVYYLIKRQFKIAAYAIASTVGLFLFPLLYFKPSVYLHFFQFVLPNLFGKITSSEVINTHGQGVVNNVVQAIEGKGLFASQDFANGYMNPLLQNNTIGSFIVGSVLLTILLRVTKRSSLIYQFYAVLNVINFINPRAWIMGLVWYIPLFLHLYPIVKTNRDRFFILLPLFMPPFTNLNGFLAYAVAIGFAGIDKAKSVSKDEYQV
jgi:Glycosyltransferase family 87